MSDVKVWSAVTITDKVMQDRPCPDYFVAEGDYDALREQVKRLSTCGTDHSTPWWQVKCEDLEAQLATIRAQLRQVEGERDVHAQDVDDLIDCCINDVLVTHAAPGGKPHDPDPQIRPLRDKIAGSLVELQTLRQLVEAFVQHFDSDFENPGLELYDGGKGLNELLAKARAAQIEAEG